MDLAFFHELEIIQSRMVRLVTETIPVEFRSARVHVEATDGFFCSGLYYFKPDGQVQIIYSGLQDIINKFKELNDLFKTAGRGLWIRSTLILSEDGKTSLEFGYADAPDSGPAPDHGQA